MKKLEIEKTKPTFIISTFKTDIIKVGLVFSISNFFIAKTSLANNWRSFSSSYLALVAAINKVWPITSIMFILVHACPAELNSGNDFYFIKSCHSLSSDHRRCTFESYHKYVSNRSITFCPCFS